MYTYTSNACDVNINRIKECKESLGHVLAHDLPYTDYRFIMDCLDICKQVFEQEKKEHQAKGF